MADVNIGEIRARLTADASDFTRNIQAATTALQQFQQAVQTQAGQITVGMREAAQGTEVLRQQLTQLNQQAISQTGFLGQMARTLDEMRTGFQQAGQAAQEARQQSQSLGETWRLVFQIAAGAGLATTLQGLVRGMRDLVLESIQLSARLQDVHRSLIALEGSSDAATRTMGQLFAMAQRTGSSFQDTIQRFRGLEAAATGTGLSHDQLLRATERLQAGFRVLGMSNDESRRGFLAWEQMLTRGRLTAEELNRQLANAVPGGLAATAQALGRTTAEFRQMAEAGVLPVNVAFTAFQQAMDNMRERTENVNTLTMAWNRFRNETGQWLVTLGDVLNTGLVPILDTLTKILETARAIGRLFPRGLSGLFVPTEANVGERSEPGVAPGRLPITPSPYTAIIEREAQRTGLDPGLISMLIQQESRFNPALTSSRGAIGLMQVMPGTAQMLQPGITEAELRDPATNIRLGTTYLKQQMVAFADNINQVQLALAAYNAGPGKVAFALRAAAATGQPATFAGIERFLPEETQRFVPGVLGMAAPGGAGRAPTAQQIQEQTQAWVTELVKANEQFETLKKQAEDLAASGRNYGGILNRDIARRLDEIVQKYAQIQGYTVLFPQQAAQLGPHIREEIDQRTREAAMLRESLLTESGRRDLLKQQVEQMEQLAIAQQAQLKQQREGQEVAARFTREETQALQERRLADRPRLAGLTIQQQIADYTQRLQTLQAQANQLGSQIEAQRAEALRPQLEAQLSQIETFLGRAGASVAEQAANAIRQRQPEIERSLSEMLRTLRQHPGLQEFADRITSAIADLPAATEEQAQRAFDRINQRQQEQARTMGAGLIQISQGTSAVGLTPLQEALAHVNRTFEEAANRLEHFREQLTELAKTGTPEVRAATDYWLQWIDGMQAGLPALQATAEGMAHLADQIRQTARATEDSARQFEFLRDLQLQVDEMRQLPETGQEAFFGLESQARRRVRLQAERTPMTEEGRAQLRERLQEMQTLERLQYGMQLFQELADSVGNAWGQALLSIADHTKTVSEAFREMGRSIMQTIIQITSQEAWKALVSLGVRLLFGAATSGIGGGASGMGGGGGGLELLMAQGGAIVNSPTHILAGENPATNPEYILNQQQMSHLMSTAIRATPSAGGQAAGNVSIHNYTNRADAEQGASRDRAQGKVAIVNEVLADLSQGEASRINRAIRTLQR